MTDFEKIIQDLLQFKITDDNQHPIGNQLTANLRNLPAVQWNIKVLGSLLAQQLYRPDLSFSSENLSKIHSNSVGRQ